jgi:predicted NAD/FAD-binding protein
MATVHTDESIMPKNKKTWSSWNYRVEEKNGKLIPTTNMYFKKCSELLKKNGILAL